MMINLKTIKLFYFFATILFVSEVKSQFPIPSTLSTGQGPIGTYDPIWQISPWYATLPANPVTGGIPFTPAYIDNNCAPANWVNPASVPPPVNTSNWITGDDSPCANNPNSGYRYFRLTLNLPSDCNGVSVTTPNSYVLEFAGYVDNQIANVFVNGTAMGITGGSYANGTQLNFTLPGPWLVGTNYIDVMLYNSPGGSSNPYGLLLVARNTNTDTDNDGVADFIDACPCVPASGTDGCCPTLSIGGQTNSCNGAPATLICSDNGAGNPSNLFVWDDGFIGSTHSVTPSVSRYYVVTLTDPYGCVVKDSVFVEVSNFNINLGNDTAFCNGDSLILDAGTGYDFYLWQDGKTTRYDTVRAGGQYHCKVSNITNTIIFNGDFEKYYEFNISNINQGFYVVKVESVFGY